jgi:DNA anti-recombination protein RmuC
MALDAAGTSPNDLLQDATRRQQALNSYEAGQQQQLEEFEARKAQEDTRIQAEMDRVTAHYAERLKQNHEQVAREKEALRNWQMAKQHEMQRISEVIEMCAKQPASAPRTEAPPASATAPTGVASQSGLASRASIGH